MIYKHAYLNTLRCCIPHLNKDAAKTAEVGGHGMHWIVMGITFLIIENHGIVFFNFCGNPAFSTHAPISSTSVFFQEKCYKHPFCSWEIYFSLS